MRQPQTLRTSILIPKELPPLSNGNLTSLQSKLSTITKQQRALRPKKYIELNNSQSQQRPKSHHSDAVDRLLKILLNKGKMVNNFISEKKIQDEEFVNRHFIKSNAIRMTLSNIIESLVAKKRIGTDLKGVNRDIIQQIQNKLGACLEKEFVFYRSVQEYNTHKQNTLSTLNNYKKQLSQQLLQLSKKDL